MKQRDLEEMKERITELLDVSDHIAKFSRSMWNQPTEGSIMAYQERRNNLIKCFNRIFGK